MQPQQGSRIELTELKTQILKKIGVERSKKYFYNLDRFLSQKLSKSEFDRSCIQLLGRDNLSLHNQLIRSILKNACQAKTPPPIHEAGPIKSVVQTAKGSPAREDVHEQSGAQVTNQNQNASIRSNGVLPASPRKIRSGMRDRKLKDRPSPLGPNGKVECVLHQSTGAEDNCGKHSIENGEMSPCDYQRPIQHLQSVAEQPRNENEGLAQRASGKLRTHGKDHRLFVEDGEVLEHANQLTPSRSPLLPPLGIPFCSASVGGARKAIPMTNSGESFSYHDTGVLSDSEMLRKRMEQIAASQGVGGVSMECANMLNNVLDVYLKRLIRSCVELVGSRSSHDLRKHPLHKHLVQGKVVNGMWPSNHLHLHSSSGSAEVMQERRPRCSISMLDFKVAMELNPQQLGEDWPLLLEKISMYVFED